MPKVKPTRALFSAFGFRPILDILGFMENLGHYLVRNAVPIPGGLEGPEGPVQVFEGQDIRTGIGVLIFKGLGGSLPKEKLAGGLNWVEQLEHSWIAEIPMGAIQATMLENRIEPERLGSWTRQVVNTLCELEQRQLPAVPIHAELIWGRGSKAWLGGIGLPTRVADSQGQALLGAVQHIAGDRYTSLPWRSDLEAYAAGDMTLEDLRIRLENIPLLPDLSRSEIKSIADVKAENRPKPGELRPESETPLEPESKLKVEGAVQERHPSFPQPAPKRIRLEEGHDPPFEVVEPSRSPVSRRWLWAVLLSLLVGGGLAGYLLWPKPAPTTPAPSGFVVMFRLEPVGSTGTVEVLEAPEASMVELNKTLAEVPGPVAFDKEGAYTLRIRVSGRAPEEFLLTVPNPSGVTIRLK